MAAIPVTLKQRLVAPPLLLALALAPEEAEVMTDYYMALRHNSSIPWMRDIPTMIRWDNS